MPYDIYGRTPEQAERDRRETRNGCLGIIALALFMLIAACSL